MHVIDLDGAWSLFGASVKAAPIAVVDTGVDLSHPEMGGGRVVRARCFVTYPNGSAQSTGQYVTDTDGHGTNVAGIADSDTNNNFGFVGTAYDAPLLAYRIFPSDPAGGCDIPPGKPVPPQCNSNTADEASAINDAVANGAKVINLSLGGDPPCSTGDPEYVAVENAIKSGVVVVAAAGNGDPKTGVGNSFLDCPAADPGVIAVGASALDDSGASIFERIAVYSNYLTTMGTSTNGAFLLAPGGDVTSSSDFDNLHWIQNIYSSTAYDASQRASCTGGLDNLGEQGDCNVEIDGTSMAAPHVSGVAALMLGINPSLKPADVATGLCNTADKIGDPKQGCGRVNAAAAVSWAQTH
jgi:subtilisin family serine protease